MMESMRLIGASLAVVAASLAIGGCGSESESSDSHAHNVISVDATVGGQDWEAYATHVPYDTEQLLVDLHYLNQDADLYVESPDGAYFCESLNTGAYPDSCIFDHPMPGDWYVEVFGWEYDPIEYTLSVTLWPSYLEATLWLTDHATGVATAAITYNDTTAQIAIAQRYLPLLEAALQTAQAQTAGETSFQITTAEGRNLGKVVLIVSDQGYQRSVHIKAVMADPLNGERHVIQTDAQQPLVIAEGADKPEEGLVNIRRKGRNTVVRLGATTGTGADVQLVVLPGPVVAEQDWTAIAGENLSLEEQLQ